MTDVQPVLQKNTWKKQINQMGESARSNIDDLRDFYQTHLAELRLERDKLLPEYSLDGLLKLTHNHKNLINDVVGSLIKPHISVFGNRPIGIFWNGSFSRNSNRLSSDYDLNFVYPEILRPEIYPIEDQICSSLAKIVGKTRDYVHAAVICHINPQKDPGSLQGLARLMFKVQWGNREPEQLKQYLTNCITPDLCYYWSATYEVIYGHTILQPIFSAVEQYEMDHANTPEFIEGFGRLVSSQRTFLPDLISHLNQIDLNEVKNIKENYKHHPFAQTFAVLALIRRRLLMDKIDIGQIKIDEYIGNPQIEKLLGPKLSEKFFHSMFHYIWSIVRLEAIFEKKTIRFGVHSIESIDPSFNSLYKKLCPEVTTDFHSYHRDQLTQLYSVLDEVLQKL
jgi:hypothetical protein